jgi:acetyltransferase-like isoleucine patch superfamily enzyme
MGAKRIPKGVTAGPGTYFGGEPRLLWDAYGSKLVVGSYTSIAAGATIFLGGHHHHRRLTTFQFKRRGGSYSKGDVTIGSDVWIGHGVTILDGVTIGHGAVVGAMSVVTKDVFPYSVVGGNPAEHIRLRFTPIVVQKMLKIAWWEWPRGKIVEALPLLLSEDPTPFVNKYFTGELK